MACQAIPLTTLDNIISPGHLRYPALCLPDEVSYQINEPRSTSSSSFIFVPFNGSRDNNDDYFSRGSIRCTNFWEFIDLGPKLLLFY